MGDVASTQCAASGCAAHIMLLLYARRRTQGLLARWLGQHLNHALQLLASPAFFDSLHQVAMSVGVVAILTLIVILTLRAVIAIANDWRTSTLVAPIILMSSD